MINFLDTSAVLNGAYNLFENVYISPLVLKELENIKTSTQNEKRKFLAREAIRAIINSTYITTNPIPHNKAQHVLKKYKFLSNINDHKLISEAAYLGKKEDVRFITSDSAQYLFAKLIPNITAYFFDDAQTPANNDDYCGWGKYYPTDEQFSTIYSNGTINVLNAKINEYCELFVDNEIKDIVRWNGKKYCPLHYNSITNKFLETVIKPRNLEQKFAFDLLQNQNIPVKLLMSSWGSGKTMLAVNYALEQVYKGVYQKLVFIRNNIIAADTNDIGYLPGDIRAKMSIWAGPLIDHLGGQEMLDRLIDEGHLEIYPLSHIRGRSICNSIVICDECENMSNKLITLLLSRIEENSEIIFCGDIAQIDNPKFEKNNGVRALVENLSGDPLFGMVKLIKSERGRVATLCDKIIPPR